MSGKTTIIIGAGVVGAALADELSLKGWTDITVLDQGELPMPGGSSSHAPGMVFQNHADKTMSELAQYTVQKFSQLEFEGKCAFEVVGGLEIATTQERFDDLRRREGWAKSWGVKSRLVSPRECIELQPLLDPERIIGGLFNPEDGAARAVVAVNAQLARAKKRGVRVLEKHEVLNIVVEDGQVEAVETDHGVFEAEIVVCCAGIWGPKIASMLGATLPMTAMEHQVAWTEPMPSLSHQKDEVTRPMLRYLDGGLYYRDRFDRLEIGSFAHRPIVVAMNEIKSRDEAEIMPSVHPFTPQDFKQQWVDTQELMPETRAATVEDGYNGIMAFTVDDYPILGPYSEVAGFWFAEGVWVTQSAGVGLAMAEWIAEGQPSSFAMQNCDINRFDAYQLAPSYVEALDVMHYVEIYDIKHPMQPLDEPRNLRVSPFYERQKELGAVFLDANGWERPHWYTANERLEVPPELPNFRGWTAQYWDPIVAAEAKHTREHVAMHDMTSLRTFIVSGPDSEQFLQNLTTGNIARPAGAVSYCLMLNDNGRIRSDVTVVRLAHDKYQVGGNGNIDLAWLRSNIGGWQVTVSDVTAGTCCIGLWGPKARDVVSRIASTIDFGPDSFRFFQAREGFIADVPVTVLRVSYVGELGWEIYTSADMGLKLWDTLFEAGRDFDIIAAGRGALNSLRIEKGYRSFGSDMTFGDLPFEAGLEFALKKSSGFIGSESARNSGTRRLVCLTYFDEKQLLLGNEPVLEDEYPVGYITSATHSANLGHGIAYAWVPAQLASEGRNLNVEGRVRRVVAEIVQEPLFDPQMEKMRS